MFYTYILYSQIIDKYYIGSSQDIKKRLLDHNKPGHKTKFTRKQIGQWVLVYKETFLTRSEAVKREQYIKSMKSKKYIVELIKMVE